MEHFDVIIIGAGLSGIGAARQLQDKCPGRTFAILESRERIGGTWDLFRYPGIRSDSDMYTMGYDSKPWLNPRAIADGPSILAYVNEAATERGIDRHIRFDRRVVDAAWSSAAARWTVHTTSRTGTIEEFSCNLLLACSGYYRYDKGHTPHFEGQESFSGPIVHPQHWPEDLDCGGKRVVIIGSGATAMTLVPALAASAAKVTMLQRSPTYVVSLPAKDAVARFLRTLLPESLAYRLTRWKNVQFQRWVYHQTRVKPQEVRRKLLALVRKALGPGYDVERHFTPRYMPWDQRLCLVPDGDLFAAIRGGRAEVVTDEIARIVPDGLELKSGQRLPADIIVSATGLEMLWLGGIAFTVDGKPVDFAETFSYKGMMFSEVPNLIYTLGYINASWTLRSELVAEFACRVVNHLHATHTQRCTPRLRPADQRMQRRPLIDDFTPGYITRAMAAFPKQGDREPWMNPQNYVLDRKIIREGTLEDGVLEFAPATGGHRRAEAQAQAAA
ncbi:MAG: flavin-containing monooxygenase [Gammaproteobacteria bacterium]